MSLDVYLEGPPHTKPETSGIFIRENGATREISREEWDARFPGTEPVLALDDRTQTTTIYNGNITHNLRDMADAAGIYAACWRPEESGIEKASQLIEPLRAGLAKLEADPEHYKTFNSPNGWGTYENFVRFVRGYLAACEANPDADVRVWR